MYTIRPENAVLLTRARLGAIRGQLEAYVEDRMREQGATFQAVDLLQRQPRCPLVNPACPDDLCILPAGHAGTREQVHVLGTTPYDHATRFQSFLMADVGTEDRELIRLGVSEAECGVRP